MKVSNSDVIHKGDLTSYQEPAGVPVRLLRGFRRAKAGIGVAPPAEIGGSAYSFARPAFVSTQRANSQSTSLKRLR